MVSSSEGMTGSRVREGKHSVQIIWSEGTREACPERSPGVSLLPFMGFQLVVLTCSLCLPGWFSPLMLPSMESCWDIYRKQMLEPKEEKWAVICLIDLGPFKKKDTIWPKKRDKLFGKRKWVKPCDWRQRLSWCCAKAGLLQFCDCLVWLFLTLIPSLGRTGMMQSTAALGWPLPRLLCG